VKRRLRRGRERTVERPRTEKDLPRGLKNVRKASVVSRAKCREKEKTQSGAGVTSAGGKKRKEPTKGMKFIYYDVTCFAKTNGQSACQKKVPA